MGFSNAVGYPTQAMVSPQLPIDFLDGDRCEQTRIARLDASDSEPFDWRTKSNSIAFIDRPELPLSGSLGDGNVQRALILVAVTD